MPDEREFPVPSADDARLQESACDVVSLVSATASIAGAVGGLGGLYYQRKAYMEQRNHASDDDPGLRASSIYDPGFHGNNDYYPGFEGQDDYYPGFEDLEY
jgi:hypothetical protein